MKLWIWTHVEQLSDRYHSGGGLAVIAIDEAQVRLLLDEYPDVKVTDEEWAAARVLELIDTPKPEVITFPNAGCC